MSHSQPAASPLIPEFGRLLGVDFGTKRIGLAISTPDQTIASPLEIYHRRSEQLDRRHFQEVIDEYRIAGVIVGLPVHVRGEEGQKAREARDYGAWMANFTRLPVDFWDERFTSAVAEEYLLNVDMTRKKRKERLDMIAAQIMLQSYLDERQRRAFSPQNDTSGGNEPRPSDNG